MNSSILAQRTAAALATIEAETVRLGGSFTAPPASRADAPTRTLLLLEAVAGALSGIGQKAAVPEAAVPEEKAPAAVPEASSGQSKKAKQ